MPITTAADDQFCDNIFNFKKIDLGFNIGPFSIEKHSKSSKNDVLYSQFLCLLSVLVKIFIKIEQKIANLQTLIHIHFDANLHE